MGLILISYTLLLHISYFIVDALNRVVQNKLSCIIKDFSFAAFVKKK